MMTTIAIVGAGGRMGRALISAVTESADMNLSAATARAGSSLLGVDAGELAGVGKLDVTVVSSDELAHQQFDVLIDFSQPELSLENLRVCAEMNAAVVLGTTGFNQQQREQINHFAQRIPIVFSANMSVGVNVAHKLLAMAAQAMADDYDIEILEAHHRFKKDAPSGTALAMGEVIAETIGRDLNDVAIYGREGFTGERDSETIGFATVRGGDVVGDHTVMFLGDGDRLEITHKASSRNTFAKGAIKAARWLQGQPNGLYSMSNVLGLN
ncbi:4-hydroxy-tetrahydrodipicolinate reductase [Umboniibacter marinipuniceus]|nr:4-hydroxy-tetrahydrodipicolinate reductase [Umboniibacter marinipuniceus]